MKRLVGWKLAMRILQSDLYAELDVDERAECDALASRNPYVALGRDSPDRDVILRIGRGELVPQKADFVTVSVRHGQCLVDVEDLALVAGISWFINDGGYVQGCRRDGGKKRTSLFHRDVLGLSKNDKRIVDHINGIRNDNRKANLRLCTTAENMRNRGKNKNNTSGFKGVHWNTAENRWKSSIRVHGKDIFLGYFDDPEIAHRAYCQAAEIHHGEFAKT